MYASQPGSQTGSQYGSHPGANFCATCGRHFAPDANFCSACGAVATPPPSAFPPSSARSRIVRPRYPRMIAGVCSGFALHFGWDVVLVRVLFAVFTVFTSGTGILIYIAAWVLLPDAPYALPVNIAPPVAPNAGASSQETTI